jgi:hypothetical protein
MLSSIVYKKPIGYLALKDQNGNPVGATDVSISGTTAPVATGTNIILVSLVLRLLSQRTTRQWSGASKGFSYQLWP